jgi:hypothetical protein
MCAKLSAGACVDVAVAVVRGEARAGVAVVRPPGHHAESNTAMGFCFYNNAGIAARAAQVRHSHPACRPHVCVCVCVCGSLPLCKRVRMYEPRAKLQTAVQRSSLPSPSTRSRP